MKPATIFKTAVFLLLLLAACTATTNLQVLQPAELKIPDHINHIVTIDRSKPEKGFVNFLEGLVTGESIGQDKAGRREALIGLGNALTRTPRFNISHSNIEMTGSKTGERKMAPMSWATIEQICSDYQADALIALESYDTDNSRHASKESRKKKDKDGNEFVETFFESHQMVSVKIGWRLYDPVNRVILDDFNSFDDVEDSATGDSEEDALRGLSDRYRVTQDISGLVGELYGQRIAPVWITVQRSYYKKSKGAADPDMQSAAHFADAGKWKEAAAIWKKHAENPPDPKTGGKAAYNMAVASEVLGKLDIALDWAEKSYLKYGNSKAKAYINTIKFRISDKERVEYQLGEK